MFVEFSNDYKGGIKGYVLIIGFEYFRFKKSFYKKILLVIIIL